MKLDTPGWRAIREYSSDWSEKRRENIGSDDPFATNRVRFDSSRLPNARYVLRWLRKSGESIASSNAIANVGDTGQRRDAMSLDSIGYPGCEMTGPPCVRQVSEKFVRGWMLLDRREITRESFPIQQAFDWLR